MLSDRIEKLSKSVTRTAKRRALESMNVSADDYITTSEFVELLGNYSEFEALRKANKIPFQPLDTPHGSPKLWDKTKAETFARRVQVLNEKAPAGKLSVEEALAAFARALIREIREAISDEIAIQAQRYQAFAPEPSQPETEAKPEPKPGALMMSRKEVGSMLGCSISTILRFEKEKADWPVPMRLGNRVKYSRAAIEDYLSRESMKAANERLKSAPLPDRAVKRPVGRPRKRY
ncbi:hypothetical protein P5W99_30000 [Paraburkholderia sp. A3BS-1L]|uniref:helix-turn-helix transcriptional regulator n=1 Tax=Paraburkholderia sp. A3BS-1L TaxID=3028375 RepID=UPI003DA7F0E1